MPLHLQELIQSEVQDGERILWAFQPIPGRFARRSLPMVMFAIPWTAFAIFWTAGAAGFKVPDFNSGESLFPLFGLPFLLIGIGMLSAPLWMRLKAGRTAYVLTNGRAIVFDGGVTSMTVRSFSPERLRDLRRVQHADLSGDLIFEKQISHDSDGDRRETAIGFLAIRDVRTVEDLVRSTAASVERSTNPRGSRLPGSTSPAYVGQRAPDDPSRSFQPGP